MPSDAFRNRWVGNCSKLPPLKRTSPDVNGYSQFGIDKSYQKAIEAEGTFFHEADSNFTDVFILENYRNAVSGLIMGILTVEDACDVMTDWQTTANS